MEGSCDALVKAVERVGRGQCPGHPAGAVPASGTGLRSTLDRRQVDGVVTGVFQGAAQWSHVVWAATTQRANPDAADMSYHCAYTFASVMRTMGASEWPALKAAFTALCADAQAKTRKAMAASCHIVAQVLGPDLVQEEVLPSFEAFLQDAQLEAVN
eukprot:Skav210264  [mRNA]  locus=scaffold1993:130975:136689:+ [translate_table: standard]